MMYLYLGGTAIREIPSSIWRHRKLETLALSDCCEFDFIGNKLSNDFGIMESLKQLYLSGCTHIDALNLSLLLDGIQSLEVLYLDGCRNLEALPHNIHKHIELKRLVLDDCRQLIASSLADLIPSSQLQDLRAVNCTLMDTESTQQLMIEKRLSDHVRWWIPPFLLMPGDQVPGKFNFQKAEGASITIPPIPKLNLRGFIFCIILSQGFDVRRSFSFYCTIYEHGEEISSTPIPIWHNVGTLISDHVFLCWHGYHSGENGGDNYSLSFEVKYYYRTVDGCREWSTEGIKECGVLPVYGLELHDKSIGSRVEIVELESTADVGGSSDENEDDQQHLSDYLEEEEEEDDLNEKFSCGCSIGLVWKYLLERSNH